VQYRVVGGEWTGAQPADGAFDTYVEALTFTTPLLPTGDLPVDLRVVDSAGNELTQTLATVSVVDPVDEILDTSLTRLGQQAAGEELTCVLQGSGNVGCQLYRGRLLSRHGCSIRLSPTPRLYLCERLCRSARFRAERFLWSIWDHASSKNKTRCDGQGSQAHCQ